MRSMRRGNVRSTTHFRGMRRGSVGVFHENLMYRGGCVVDVFQDTGMEPHAQKLGLGAYVVCGVLPPEQCANWHKTLT